MSSTEVNARCDKESLCFIPPEIHSAVTVHDPLWNFGKFLRPSSYELVVEDASNSAEVDAAAAAATAGANTEATTADGTTKNYRDGNWVRAGTFDSLNTEVLKKVGEAAPFGKGTETVFDPTVRNALHIKKDRYRIIGVARAEKDFSLAKRKDATERYLASIRKELGLPDGFEMRLQKVHIYDKGGFFSEHKDTPSAANHVATIVHVLKTNFKGGRLNLTRGGENYSVGPGHVAIFPTDVKHAVSVVTEGCRVSIQIDVFAKPGTDANFDPRQPIADAWRSYVDLVVTSYKKDPAIAIELTHSYPLGDAQPREVPPGRVPLKPADQGLVDVLEAHPLVKRVAFFVTTHTWHTATDDYCKYPNYSPCDFPSDLFTLEVPDSLLAGLSGGVAKPPKTIPFVMGKDFRERVPFDRHVETTGNEGVNLELEYRTMCLFVYLEGSERPLKKEPKKEEKEKKEVKSE